MNPAPTMYADGRVIVHPGDCRDVLARLPACSVDAVVTDPPYSLISIAKRFGKPGSAPAQYGSDGRYARASAGFMGCRWDNGETAFDPAFWAQVLRVLKPGGYLLAMGGTRTFHRLACAIEDAGFEIRDMIAWVYGTGFPKSHDVSKGLDRMLGAEREKVQHDHPRNPRVIGGGKEAIPGGSATRPWLDAAFERGYHELDSDVPASWAARQWDGFGSALKPALEPVCLARKPLDGTLAENVLRWGTGALNIDGTRVPVGKPWEQDHLPLDENRQEHIASASVQSQSGSRKSENAVSQSITKGRFPSNLIHDGGDEVTAAFPDASGGYGKRGGNESLTSYGFPEGSMQTVGFGDSGSAARFFYTVKRDGPAWNEHASAAEQCSLLCHRHGVGSVQQNALDSHLLSLAQNVKSAGSLCDSCAIAIAQSIVAMRLGQSPEVSLSQASISERSKHILSHSLVLYVAGRENTDIITTIPSLQILFGFVLNAIAENINLGNSDHGGKFAKRFHYTSKADADDRIGSKHPTCKPLDLIQYLIRLICPKGGTVLDPFAGTGTTGEAALREGMRAILIEREAQYLDDIARRMRLAVNTGPEERRRESLKARGKIASPGPLFEQAAE